MKVFLRVLLVGALGGGVISAWISPKFLSWYFNPPVEQVFNCTKPIEWALQRMQLSLVIGIGVGAALSLFVYYVGLRKRTPAPPLREQRASL